MNFKSRKLIMSVAVLVLSTILLWADLISADNWVVLAQANLLAYAGGNVGAKFASRGQPGG